MNHASLMDRLGLRSKGNNKHRVTYTHLRIEPLEERRLLSAYDILFSTYFDTKGSSVLRYNDTTQLPVPGGVATGVGGLGQAAGLAVAPDGSYYVSSDATDNVLHVSNSGKYLGVLGANDPTQAPLEYPGTLAFGPNGNLYVADLGANAIFQFDTNSTTQQYLAADTFPLPSYFTPGGFTFATDGTHDLIVGSLEYQSVVQFNADGSVASTPIPAYSGINPAAILALSNGNLLIADTDFDNVATSHHQIVEYNAATSSYGQFINLTTPTDSSGDLPQPTSLLLDTDGNLLVGMSPDDYDDGAVAKFNIQTGALMETIATGVGDPSGLALVPVESSDILFSTYFDTNGSSVLRYDDATQLPVPGGVATGVGGLTSPLGIAVAPDGSYYVSSSPSGDETTGEVLHYSNSGQFLGVLGANDWIQAPLEAPGTLAFGPNGNLYVADLGANAIFQFDTTSTTQQYQYQAGDTLWLPEYFTPGGFTFATDGTRDLIVGSLEYQSVVEFNADGSVASTPIPAYSGIDPASILALSNGNLLIADTDFDQVATSHHQIVEYNAATTSYSQFINLTQPADSSGDLPQPTSLLLDTDGNLLVGMSPDDFDDGVVAKFNIQTGALMETIATGVGDPSGLALVPSQVSDLLVGNFVDSSVERYTYCSAANTFAGVPGVASGDNGLFQTAGAAVAPDGSFYVSSGTYSNLGYAEIYHYSNAGVFLGILGASDPVQAPLYFPGTMTFGPNGDLYVADLESNAIFQFDTTSTTQQYQYQAGDTLWLPEYFTPGGFTFATDGTRDLIVGSLEYQSVVEFNADGSVASTPIPAYSGIDPVAILPLSNGNLLIADTDFDNVATSHHQIVEYNAATDSYGQFTNLTQPTDSSGDLPQPTSLALAPDGNLLVGLAPDQTDDDGAVEEFNIATGQYIANVISSIGAPAGLAYLPPNVMSATAADWTNSGYAGLRIASPGDGLLHVFGTGTMNDVVTPQSVDNESAVQISGPDNAADALTLDFNGGNPIPPDGVTFDGGSGTATNTVIISGSPDLSGTLQTVGCVTFGQGSLSNETVPGGSLAIECGTISGDLTGPGGLSKTGCGTVTLSGSDSYQGGTMVTAGMLVVTTPAALPAGSSLTVGAGGTFVFDPSVVAQTPQAVSSNSAAVGVSPAAASGALISAPTAQIAAAVVAPLQVQALDSQSTAALVSRFTTTAFLPAALPLAQPAALPSRVASNSVGKSYPQAAGPAVGQAHGAVGCPAWLGSSLESSNAEDSTTEKDRRIAVLDAVLAQYGSP